MKIIGFSASPRREGNTTFIIEKILEGANEQGAETEVFYFSNLAIKPCQGCLGCHKGDRGCVIRDDMQRVYVALEQADALVLGSPVYMGQMSAQAKIFTDRLFAQIHPRFSPRFKEQHAGKKLLLAFNQGNPDLGMFQAYFDYTRRMFEMLEFDVKGLHVVTGMPNAPARERDDLHAGLKDIGALLVS